jgi:hypothetical protein
MNKTITISFNSTGKATFPDGRSHNFSTAVTRTIYVSSAGRLFMRNIISSANGKRSASGDFAPDDSGASPGYHPGKGSFQFEGNTLVGVTPWAGGARRITATFDPGFTSCTVTIIEGHEAGGVIRRKGPNGEMHEVTEAATSSPRCSIQSGNALAN